MDSVSKALSNHYPLKIVPRPLLALSAAPISHLLDRFRVDFEDSSKSNRRNAMVAHQLGSARNVGRSDDSSPGNLRRKAKDLQAKADDEKEALQIQSSAHNFSPSYILCADPLAVLSIKRRSRLGIPNPCNAKSSPNLCKSKSLYSQNFPVTACGSWFAAI